MNNMKNALIKIDESELISDSRNGVTRLVRYYNLNGHTFKIFYENSNGSPMGFNSKKSLSQYAKNDAKWNYLEDIKSVKMPNPTPSYFAMEDSKKHCFDFFDRMEAHLVKIYA